MKNYLACELETQLINESLNYELNSNVKEIYIKEGIESNLLIINKKDFNTKIYLEKNSIVNIYNVILTLDDFNSTIDVYLKEKGATCNVINLVLGSLNSKVSSNIMIYHEVSHTFSDLKCYCISKDKNIININNNAFIKKNAKGSIAKQNTKGLTLSKESSIKAQPNLFIDEYDVSASHGVAMGSLNKEDLFYLMSRGLTYQDASKIVIMGFIAPILLAIDHEEKCNIISNLFNEILK